MMSNKKLLIPVMFLVLLMALPLFASCIYSNSSTATNNLISPTPTIIDTKSPAEEYYNAVRTVSEQAISITYSYQRRTIFLTIDDPAFPQILRFLKESTVQKITYHDPRVKGPFPLTQEGYYLIFGLRDGSDKFLYSTGNDIRFETNDAYLIITCSQDFWQLLADTGKRVLLAISNLPKPPNLSGKIVFGSNRDGNNEIYRMNADGTSLTRLTENTAYDGGPVWSPDGTKIAYMSIVRDSQQSEKLEIFVMNSDGTNPLRLTNGGGLNPTWSPDGKLITFASGYGSGSDIYVMDVDGSNKKQLTRDSSLNDKPDWSQDGTKIVFFSMRDISPGGKGGKPQIYVMNTDGTDQHPLIGSTDSSDTMPKWSPDGGKIVFVSDRNGQRRKIYLMNSDGTGQIILSSIHTGEDIHPCWSLDGSKIIFTSTRLGVSEIWVMNADGTNQAPLLQNNSEKDVSDMFPSWWQSK
jgi:Tol biopolymer transport system component